MKAVFNRGFDHCFLKTTEINLTLCCQLRFARRPFINRPDLLTLGQIHHLTFLLCITTKMILQREEYPH